MNDRERILNRFALVQRKDERTDSERIPPNPAIKLMRTLDLTLVHQLHEDSQELISVFLSQEEKVPPPQHEKISSLLQVEKEFLQFVLMGEASVEKCNSFAKANGLMLGYLVDQINQKTLESFDDLVLQEEGDFYLVSEASKELLYHTIFGSELV